MIKIFRLCVRLLVVPAGVIYLIVSLSTLPGMPSIDFQPVRLAFAMLALHVAMALSAERFRWILLSCDVRLTILLALRMHMHSLFYFVAAPFGVGADISRYTALRSYRPHVERRAFAFALIADRVAGILGAALAAAIAGPFVWRFSESDLRFVATAIGFSMLLAFAIFFYAERRWVELKEWRLALYALRWRMAVLVLISAIVFGLFGLFVAEFAGLFGVDISYIASIGVVAACSLLGVIPVSLLGVSVAEVGAFWLAQTMGYDAVSSGIIALAPFVGRAIGAAEGGLLEFFAGISEISP